MRPGLSTLATLLRRTGAIAVARRLLPKRVAVRLNTAVVARSRQPWAHRYLCGDGLEIGAMHMPLAVPRGVRVRYVDRCSREHAIAAFPELDTRGVVRPDIVEDGFTLASISPLSQDFVIANHVLEHAPNPLQVLERWWQVLLPGGVLFVIVPLQDRSFDRGRTLTSVAHMFEDYDLARAIGPGALAARNAEHYAEWVSISEPRMAGKSPNRAGAVTDGRAAQLAANSVEIHFHTFSVGSFGEFVRAFAKRASTPSRVLEVVDLGAEVLAVLRKADLV